jgi:mono/diheme cytochrome c family protein
VKAKVVVAMIVLAAVAWLGFAVQSAREIERTRIAFIPTVEGAALYAAYCADCHGGAGRGDGRASAFLSPTPADLSGITDRTGEFDHLAIENRIAAASPRSGSEMPHWEILLGQTYRNRARELVMLHNLASHVEALQERQVYRFSSPAGGAMIVVEPIARLATVDGEAVYAAYCAGCHGLTGVGNPTVGSCLGRKIPDLTRLGSSEETARIEVAAALKSAHMLPEGAAETWQELLADTYPDGVRQKVLVHNVAAHVASLKIDQ